MNKGSLKFEQINTINLSKHSNFFIIIILSFFSVIFTIIFLLIFLFEPNSVHIHILMNIQMIIVKIKQMNIIIYYVQINIIDLISKNQNLFGF